MSKKLKLPIGYDIFSSIKENDLDFIDKTLLIKEVFEDAAGIMLFTRPRRFGKTLNLSMLHHFVAAEAFGRKTAELFKGFKICDIDGGKFFSEHKGKYPAIFFTLKGVKDHNFANAYASMVNLISNVYSEHRYLLDSPKLDEDEKEAFHAILKGQTDQAKVVAAIGKLCEYLYKHFDSNVWLFIDEYDTPIQSAYIKGYYDQMIDFIRNMFGVALKTNPYLHKAVITGILRISKESLFSDLNNIEVYSTLQNKYSQYFGFTEEEVNYILQRSGLENKAAEIKAWYNGYQFGNTTIYNPWSIINVANKEILQPYWINTSGNDLIREIIIKSKPEIKKHFEDLLQEKPIKITLDEHVTFGDLHNNETAVFSLLLAAGYLKATSYEITPYGFIESVLTIPNFEVSTVYCIMIKQWLARSNDILWFGRFIEKLLLGKVSEFAVDLKEVILQIASYHDIGKKPEVFYHALMLGLTAHLYKQGYIIKSNQESGLGRFDIAIIPKDMQQPAIILELKSVSKVKTLTKEAEKALKQIDVLEYDAEIKQRGIAGIIKIGLAFCGKEFVVKHSQS